MDAGCKPADIREKSQAPLRDGKFQKNEARIWCWCSQLPLAAFTGMLAAKMSNRLLCKGMRSISAIRCLLRRYNNHEEVCSVTLLARQRYLDIKSHPPRDRKGAFHKRCAMSMTERMLSAAASAFYGCFQKR